MLVGRVVAYEKSPTAEVRDLRLADIEGRQSNAQEMEQQYQRQEEQLQHEKQEQQTTTLLARRRRSALRSSTRLSRTRRAASLG